MPFKTKCAVEATNKLYLFCLNLKHGMPIYCRNQMEIYYICVNSVRQVFKFPIKCIAQLGDMGKYLQVSITYFDAITKENNP